MYFNNCHCSGRCGCGGRQKNRIIICPPDPCHPDPCPPPHPSPQKRERGLLSEFDVCQLPDNRSGRANIPLDNSDRVICPATPQPGPSLTMRIDDRGDRVWLTGTVGWQNTADRVAAVEFSIFRDSLSGNPIFSTRDSAAAGSNRNPTFVTTTFTHVDFHPTRPVVRYFLTARELTGTVTVIGPITFVGAEIESNNPCNCNW